ncbi:hypothetical protein AB0A77_28420 [Streptomyces varsoviensis]|uniref:hypothetical protein n=1 Tax=Streptomyces varsoviensis TaxID=67373 RepID=UPI0033C8E8AF
MASYDAIGAAEEATWTKPEHGAAPSHAMTFVTPDGGTELVCLDVPGVLPIPRPGDQIGLHDHDVVVSEVWTHYGRDEETGRVRLFTLVRVTTDTGVEAG